ncbi:MAG: rhodanese-like domain-containing protein [Candidatus Micrarchaeia archaeon]
MQKTISAEQFLKSRKDYFSIDVRTIQEWENYHEQDMTHIPFEEILAYSQKLKEKKAVVLVCRSGARSEYAAKCLQKRRINAINLQGGLLELVQEKLKQGLITKEECENALSKIR